MQGYLPHIPTSDLPIWFAYTLHPFLTRSGAAMSGKGRQANRLEIRHGLDASSSVLVCQKAGGQGHSEMGISGWNTCLPNALTVSGVSRRWVMLISSKAYSAHIALYRYTLPTYQSPTSLMHDLISSSHDPSSRSSGMAQCRSSALERSFVRVEHQPHLHHPGPLKYVFFFRNGIQIPVSTVVKL